MFHGLESKQKGTGPIDYCSGMKQRYVCKLGLRQWETGEGWGKGKGGGKRECEQTKCEVGKDRAIGRLVHPVDGDCQSVNPYGGQQLVVSGILDIQYESKRAGQKVTIISEASNQSYATTCETPESSTMDVISSTYGTRGTEAHPRKLTQKQPDMAHGDSNMSMQ